MEDQSISAWMKSGKHQPSNRPVYPELTGYRSRDREVPPPVFPDACSTCGASRTDDPNVTYESNSLFAKRDGMPKVGRHPNGWWASYACGGSYTPKPQIQNHTEYFWGSCGAVNG